MAKRIFDDSPEAKAQRSRLARRSKHKGSRFELLVAKKIVEAAGAPFAKKDCYRTPQSGGHRFAGANDMQISECLLEHLPFGIEAKHRKSFRFDQMFELTTDIREWHDQVLAAVERDGRNLAPMIVARGNGGLIYAASYLASLMEYDDFLHQAPGFVYRYRGAVWKMVLFDAILAALRTRTVEARQDGALKAAQTAA